jgi:AraC family transcriptional regulator, positive regulator of tynA and feaB
VTAAMMAETPFVDMGERETYWEGAVNEFLAPMAVRVPSAASGGQRRVRSRAIGDLVLADWACPPMEGTLRKTVDSRDERGTVVVLAGLGGEERISVGGTDVVLEEGALVVSSGGRAGEGFVVPRGVRKRTLRLPRTALEAAGSGGDIPICLALEKDRPFVHLVHVFLGEVWHKLPDMNAAETEAARTALITLLAAAIRAAGEDSVCAGSTSLVLRAQLEQWIVANLRTGRIRVEHLATAHNVSTRTVHRTFALTGDTMIGVVRARRMAGVRENLLHTDLTIAAIAYRWNYYDPSHLGREFRHHYGMSPSDYRQTYGVQRTISTHSLTELHMARPLFGALQSS